MKKVLSIIFAALIIFGLSGCGREPFAPPAHTAVQAPELNIQPEAEPDEKEVMPSDVPAEETEGADTRPADQIVQDIISLYGSSDESREEELGLLFDELNRSDERQAELWREILDYRDYANDVMPLNLKRLPDDLPQENNMCIVVLGYALKPYGTMQSELIGRLQTALTCARQYPNAYILCTGGGTASNNDKVTEAGQMVKWLKSKGVKESRLIVEDRSLTTVENAVYSYRLLKAEYPDVDTVAIVSSDYHIAWGSVLFEAVFLKGASDSGENAIHVVSNAAYPTGTADRSSALGSQTYGLMQIAVLDVNN